MTEIPTTAGIYTLNDLKNAWSEGKRFKFVYFWKPDDSKDVQSTACFSQWQPSTFTVNSDVYFCAEQFMMASKARLFPNNKPILNEIMKTFDPKRMKSLGRKVHNNLFSLFVKFLFYFLFSIFYFGY